MILFFPLSFLPSSLYLVYGQIGVEDLTMLLLTAAVATAISPGSSPTQQRMGSFRFQGCFLISFPFLPYKANMRMYTDTNRVLAAGLQKMGHQHPQSETALCVFHLLTSHKIHYIMNHPGGSEILAS